MNSLQIHAIKLVRDTVNRYASSPIPKIDEICTGLGIKIKEDMIQDGRDGMYFDNTIIINSKIRSKGRKRFTIFHEVMHYFFETDADLISKLHELTDIQIDEHNRQIELYCNIGAAEFLMPREEFTKLYKAKGFNVQLIPLASRHFKSSTIAATIQLAQVAPNQCITAICELTHDETPSLQPQIFNEKEQTDMRKLRVTYAASSPNVKYTLAKNTVIPYDHLIYDAIGQDNPVEGDSYVPFRSGKKMPCHCEALSDGNRIYVIFHLSTPTSTNEMQINLFGST